MQLKILLETWFSFILLIKSTWSLNSFLAYFPWALEAEFGTKSFYFTGGALLANQESGGGVAVVASTIWCTKNVF